MWCAISTSPKSYGPKLDARLIHVYRLKPLAEIGEACVLNREEDLRRVCPKCRAMLHRVQPALSIESHLECGYEKLSRELRKSSC